MTEHAEELLRWLLVLVGGGIPILLSIFGWFIKRWMGGIETGLTFIRDDVMSMRKKLDANHDEVQLEIARLDKGLALLDKDVQGIKEKLNGKIVAKPRVKN